MSSSVALRPVRLQAAAAARLDGGDVLALLVPAAMFVQVHFVGQLYLSEVLLIALLPPLLLRHTQNPSHAMPKTFLVLCLVWLYGQIATDIARGTRFHDLARGWSNIAFTLLEFAAMFLLLDGRPRRYVLFACGLAIGSLLDFILAPSNDLGDPWKFGLATPFAIGVVLITCSRSVQRVPLLASLMLGVLALINLMRDFRSLALVLFISALYVAATDLFGGRARYRNRTDVATLFRLALVGAASIFAFSIGYAHAAKSGWLGSAAQQKYQLESQSRYGIIGGGRPEFQASLHAIADSPLLGHGSWPKDPKYLNYLDSGGQILIDPTWQTGLIPTHSYITGAWVDAGVLGVPVWIWVLAVAVRALMRQFVIRDPLAPLVVFSAMFLGWAIPFSPYGGPARLFTDFYVLVLLAGIERAALARVAQRRGAQ